MSLPINLRDGLSNGFLAGVSPANELYVAPRSYNQSQYQSMNTTTAFSFAAPKVGSKIVMTGIIANATRAIGANGVAINIFTSSVGPDVASATSALVTIDLAKQQTFGLMNLNLLIDKGQWINATVNDNSGTNLTVYYYYISDEVITV